MQIAFVLVRVVASGGVFIFLVLLHDVSNRFLNVHVLRQYYAFGGKSASARVVEPTLDLPGMNRHKTDW